MATQSATTTIQASSQSEYSALKSYLQRIGIVATFNDVTLQATITATGTFTVPS